MALAAAPGVHLDHGTDHQHGGAGGADKAGQQGAEQQKSHVHPGGTGQVAFQGNVTGHAEQAEEQNDEGKIVVDDTLQHDLHRRTHAAHHGKRDQESRGADGNHDGLVMLPPVGFHHREGGDAGQQSSEGDAQPGGHARGMACGFRSGGSGGDAQGEER